MTVFFNENFNAGLPGTWSADAYWKDDDPGNRNTNFDDTYTPGTIQVGYDVWDPPFMIVDSYYEGTVNIDASLISPIIDCSMYSDIRLVFNNWFQNYESGNQEKGDIDIRINGGAWQNVARFIDNYYTAVDAGRDVVIRLPQSVDYQSNVQIRWHYYNANEEWFWGIDDVRLMGNMIATDYFVQIFPLSQNSGNQAGNTVAYRMKVKNLGQLSDSYDLSVSDNLWTTTIWDSAGINPLSNTGALVSRQELNMMVLVEIPATAPVRQIDIARIMAVSTTDTNVTASAKITTTAKPEPGTIPWFEDFPTALLDTTKWTYNHGLATISTLGINEPSAPYSLNFNGDSTGGDEVRSEEIDLSKDTLSVILSYYYQRTGGGESPDSNDDLFVDYFSASGNWVNLKQYAGAGEDMTTFHYDEVILPQDARHKGFRIKFHNNATKGNNDDWFVDDIALVNAPDIYVTHNPDPFDFTLDLGDSTLAAITIANSGKSDLIFQITDLPVRQSFSQMVQFSSPSVQDILTANYAYSQQLANIQNNLDGSDDNSGKAASRRKPELSYSLEAMLKAHERIDQGYTTKAFVVDGWGTDSYSAIATWDYLNLNYKNYGNQPIVIDYTTLNKDNITYPLTS